MTTELPEGVDPRLDNRVGDQRPKVEKFPAKPQHIDGPDVLHQREHTEKTLKDARKAAKKGDQKGMFSPGPHGLSSEDVRETDKVQFGTEGFTEAEEKKDAPGGASADGDKTTS